MSFDMGSESDIIRTIMDLDDDGLIRFIIMYGSRTRNCPREGSDLDICIYYDADEKGRFDFRTKALGVLFTEDIDLHIFQDLPLQVRMEVLKGKVLYSDDDVFLHDLAYHQIKEFDDFRHHLYDYLDMEKIR